MEALETGNFAMVANSSLVKDGLEEFSIVFLVGEGLLPESEEDPYLLRRYFLAAPVVDNHIKVDAAPFLINPKDFIKVSEETETILQAQYEADFGGEHVVH